MLLASLRGPAGPAGRRDRQAPYLGQVTAEGLRDSQGVALIDTTTPCYNAAQRQGRHLHVHRRRVEQQLGAARPPVRRGLAPRSATPTPSAPRRSAGSSTTTTRASAATPGTARARSMVSTVNFSDGNFCNAFFSSGLQQMVYGNPCDGPERQHAAGHPRRHRPRDHPRRHRLDRRAELHRPVGRAQRGVLRLLRQRDRRPLLPARHARPSARTPAQAVTGPQPLCVAEPGRHARDPLHAQRQRLWTTTSTSSTRAFRLDRRGRPDHRQRRRAPQLRDLEQRAVDDPHPAGQDRQQAGLPVPAGPRLRPDRLLHADPPARPELHHGRRGQRRRGHRRQGRRRADDHPRRQGDLRPERAVPGLLRPRADRRRHRQQQAAVGGQPGRVGQEHRLDQPASAGPAPRRSAAGCRPTR